ncbi:protein HLJ1 [Drosophila erecta]|uniref:J domain-containing protein n=1 Tax=Drosophila erecta TaxID=7220 RepID=B3NWR5_DROER|nr:protein HLJ1 [Drosophila erecta]EDV47227.1 uncharacterized protein Dere_GG17762 [Drosophila erecta]
MEEDYYMILGVDPTATEQEIKDAYRRMALIYHPDKNKHPRTTAHFQKINRAFQVLSNAMSRREHDRSFQSRRSEARRPEDRRPEGPPDPQPGGQGESLDTLNTVIAVGVALVAVFAGFGVYHAIRGGNNNK